MSPETVLFAALFLGTGLAWWTDRLSHRERRMLQVAPLSPKSRWLRAISIVGVTILLAVAYHWASMPISEQRCLDIDEVQPSWPGRNWRYAYHMVLISLLIVATAIDFDCYMIPDLITIPGMVLGIAGACLIQEAQICHLWVDWSIAVPQLRGPLIPAWYDSHKIWHALAWSLCGMTTGATITWLAREVSSRVLGQQAMGFGDVTLMAMIGSFVGWQAVTLVFLFAPLTGLTIGIVLRMLSGKTYLPYGPWLSIATVIVLFAWARLWKLTRLTFSDWFSVLILAIVGGTLFVVLLWLLQLYKTIPTRKQPLSQ